MRNIERIALLSVEILLTVLYIILRCRQLYNRSKSNTGCQRSSEPGVPDDWWFGE